jgi:glutamate--cysteine ligase
MRGGVQYVEVRALDVSACDANGVSAAQLRFLEAFLIYCLLADSPQVDAVELEQTEQSQLAVARNGRDPSLMLMRGDNGVPLQTWAREILEDMTGVCELLDRGRGDGAYSNALASQAVKVADPEETPSAMILEAMRSNGEPFFTFAMRMSRHHREQFVGAGPLQSQRHDLLQREVARSLEKQREIEAADRISFESYLESYFRS